MCSSDAGEHVVFSTILHYCALWTRGAGMWMDARPDSCALRCTSTGTFALTTKQSVNHQMNEGRCDDASMFCDQKWARGQVSIQWLRCGLRVVQQHPVTGSAAETDGARTGAVYIICFHPKMETLWSGGSKLSAPINSQQYEATIVFGPQAGVSFIGDIRADADFRPEGMVGLGAISCSLDY